MPCNKNGRAEKDEFSNINTEFFLFSVIIKEVISKGYKWIFFFFLISKAFLRVGIVTVY